MKRLDKTKYLIFVLLCVLCFVIVCVSCLLLSVPQKGYVTGLSWVTSMRHKDKKKNKKKNVSSMKIQISLCKKCDYNLWIIKDASKTLIRLQVCGEKVRCGSFLVSYRDSFGILCARYDPLMRYDTLSRSKTYPNYPQYQCTLILYHIHS